MSRDHVERARRAAKMLDHWLERGHVPPAHLESARNELVDLAKEHSVALDELEQLRAQTREEIERQSYAVAHAKAYEEKCDQALAEVKQLRAGRIPLMTLRQTWRNGWMDRARADRQAIADSDKQRDAYERAFVRYMSEDPAEDDKDPYRPVDGPDDPAFGHQAMRDGVQ